MDLSERQIIFVVGVGRSGTTLTQLMIASHPNVRFLPEINFIRRYAGNNTLTKMKRHGLASMKQLLFNDSKVRRLPFALDADIEKCFESNAVERCLLNRIFERLADPSSQYFLYKAARLIEHASALLRVLKNARIIHVVRDPRDVLASKINADWSRDRALWRNLAAGRIQLNLAAAAGTSEFADRFYEIKYETCLDQPEQTLRGLCRFLELDYSPAMLEFNTNASQLVFSDEMQYKQNLFKPLMSKNSGKWESQLTDYQVALAETVFSSEMKSFGYEPINPQLSSKQRAALHLEATMIITSYYAYLPLIIKRNRGIARLA